MFKRKVLYTSFLDLLFPDPPLDSEVLTALGPWKSFIDAKGMQVVGHSESLLLNSPCVVEECKLGNFFADALVYHYKTFLCANQADSCTDQIIGMINSGSFRANIDAGRALFFHD